MTFTSQAAVNILTHTFSRFVMPCKSMDVIWLWSRLLWTEIKQFSTMCLYEWPFSINISQVIHTLIRRKRWAGIIVLNSKVSGIDKNEITELKIIHKYKNSKQTFLFIFLLALLSYYYPTYYLAINWGTYMYSSDEHFDMSGSPVILFISALLLSRK